MERIYLGLYGITWRWKAWFKEYSGLYNMIGFVNNKPYWSSLDKKRAVYVSPSGEHRIIGESQALGKPSK